jgi:isoleucyl-tRNA synthetase
MFADQVPSLTARPGALFFVTMTEELELKKTVNLPRTDFSQKANLGQMELARLKKWQEMGLYEKVLASRAGREKFILHDGPPYANADIHIGTALNKILKDFVVKSRTMMGFQAPYVPGYDCHGLPIENYVERKLKEKGKNKDDIPTNTFRRICREHASTAMNNQTRDFQRLGVLGEWDNPYLTMSNEYEAETARLFGKYVERGYVYRGARPVYWDVYDQTALAEAEVEYADVVSPSVYVKFPLESDPALIDESLAGKNVKCVIWTTTPWTLPANLGIAVNPRFDYSAIEAGDEVLIIASELVADVATKAGFDAANEIVRFKGDKLDKLEARHPWIDRKSLLMLGDHVTLGDDSADEDDKKSGKTAGTGLVHTAPGHGTDDFYIGQRHGLQAYCPVNAKGVFTDEVEYFAGEFVFKANPKIVEFMRENGSLLFHEDYTHRYPHGWRSHKPVIYRATPQWFIAMDNQGDKSLRAQALREVERVNWHPSWGEGRMVNMLKGRPDWCVSRQRVWGVPIVAFHCSSCENCVIDAEVIYHVADIFAAETADAWYNREAAELLPDGYKCPECGAAEFTKETDILDVWFDSGSSSVAVLETRGDTLHFPADLYLEGGDQYRGWFNSSLMCGIAAHDRAPYKQIVTHGWVVDGEGKKQSKSLGNVTAPKEIIDKSGADVLRLWAAAVDYTEDVRCSEEILSRVVDAYRKMRNTLRYALGNIDGFDLEADGVPLDEMLEIDAWAMAMLDDVTTKVIAGYETYDFQSSYNALYNFCTVALSARYFDIIKDRLYIFAPRSHERRSAQTALYHIADSLIRLMAPLLAYTADEAWEAIPGDRQDSVHLAEFPKAAEATERADILRTDWERIFAIRDDVLRSLETARGEKQIGSSLEAKAIVTADAETTRFLLGHYAQLRYIFIVSQVEVHEGDAFGVIITKADGEKCERCWNYSTRVGEFSMWPTVCERCAEALTEITA